MFYHRSFKALRSTCVRTLDGTWLSEGEVTTISLKGPTRKQLAEVQEWIEQYRYFLEEVDPVFESVVEPSPAPEPAADPEPEPAPEPGPEPEAPAE